MGKKSLNYCFVAQYYFRANLASHPQFGCRSSLGCQIMQNVTLFLVQSLLCQISTSVQEFEVLTGFPTCSQVLNVVCIMFSQTCSQQHHTSSHILNPKFYSHNLYSQPKRRRLQCIQILEMPKASLGQWIVDYPSKAL